MQRATARRWIDPHSIPKDSTEFESRPIWWHNPVHEVIFTIDGIPAVIERLTDAAENILRVSPTESYEIWINARRPDGHDAPHLSVEDDVPELIFVPSA